MTVFTPYFNSFFFDTYLKCAILALPRAWKKNMNLTERFMNSVSFKKNLLGVQEELLRFAYKLTADREEANDLLQETSLKALDNEDKYIPDTNFKDGCIPLCVTSL